MPSSMNSPSIPLPSPPARRFVRLLVGFGVGVGVLSAPFLGNVGVPGFTALLVVLPPDLRGLLIPISALLIGSVAAAVHFYSDEKIARTKLRKRFVATLSVILSGLLILVFISIWFVVRVPLDKEEKEHEPVVVGAHRLPYCPGCPCKCPPGEEDAECLKGLPMTHPGLCWAPREILIVKTSLTLTYLVVTTSFGVLIGLLQIKPPAVQPRKRRRRVKPPTPPGTPPPPAPPA